MTPDSVGIGQMKETMGMGRNCGFSGLRGGLLAGLTMSVALAACAEIGQPEPQTGVAVSRGVETRVERQARITYKEPGGDPSFGGFVVADEPSAVLIAQQVLDQGGNAADAAAALYFALSVTYPAAAGLGGGGICLVRDAGERKVESLAFLARSPRGGGAVAIPGNVRGFSLLQSRHGNQPWSAIVGPAERLAGTGFPLSRASARALADAASVQGAPAFTGADGAPLRELQRVTQSELAATLTLIRSRGVTGFYAGETARALVAGAREAGGTLSLDDLADDRPVTAPAQMLPSSGGAVAAPSEALGAGVFAAALWRDIEKAGPAELAEAARRTAAALGAENAARDFGSTAFATADGRGGAVACAVTMSGPFGTGRAAPGTGVVFAPNAQQSANGIASAFLMPVIVTSNSGTQIFFSGAGAGEPKGAASILSAARLALAGTAAEALAASPADARSPAHAISCPIGNVTRACSFAIGPRSDGMGAVSARSGS